MKRFLLLGIFLTQMCGLCLSISEAEVIKSREASRYFKPVSKAPYVCRLGSGIGELGTISTKRIRPGVTIWSKLPFQKEKRRLMGLIREARQTLRAIPKTDTIVYESKVADLEAANDAFRNLTVARLDCKNGIIPPLPTPIPPPPPSPTQTVTPTPTCSFISCGNPPVLTHWANYLDDSEEEWQKYLETLNVLKNIGFTHAGIAMGYNGINLDSRVQELRRRGFQLALHDSAGHIVLNDPTKLDPANHSTNGQNLKYFDTPGFNPFACVSACGSVELGENCSLKPRGLAHDPGYTGALWQEELTILESKLTKSGLASGDVMLFDTELWGPNPDSVDYCYPHTLEQSVGRYTGTLAERHAQYYRNWRERAGDLKAKVKSKSSEIFTLFYNENIPEYASQTWIPSGSGDANSPRFYFAPNLTKVREVLKGGDHRGSYVWISFSTTSGTWANPPGGSNTTGWITTEWDPVISQKLGLMLKEAGVSGIIIYPGPGHHGLSKEYFYRHSIALVKGFYLGTDPGPLTEICQDGWDNDGDGDFDEGCPIQ